ncbi:MAG: NUDIX hydrolase [Bacteroidota bacterium]|nr:NUDIX hydrolase [Bacteroidota bacterium]MDP4206206.1 NUDIX hydrolase [Bacteroidota bacterium]
MGQLVNPSISVDIVIFGFDGLHLKVLLVRRDSSKVENSLKSAQCDHKLPGSLIFENEDLTTSAHRILKELTGLSDIYLRQLQVFSDPNRIKRSEDLDWITKNYGVEAHRIVTVAYYSLIKIDNSVIKRSVEGETSWSDVQTIRQLAFDHKQILLTALETLTRQLQTEPVAFELLPKKFTIRQLQNLYEAVLGTELDNRNFRKKVLKFSYLIPLEEKEKDVAHKPARFYRFDKTRYLKEVKRKYNLSFIHS